MQSIKKDKIKEQAVFEKRYWMRISYICNNRCIFCLDAENTYDENFISFDSIKKEINNAYKDNYTRLIISGGEPTIHPDYINIISYAKKAGFDHIQTITNGRMFSYKSFTNNAINAGLNEVTLSVHGHNSELHDKITGIDGSFEQILKGIQNVQDTNRCIVNTDIVINKLNYKYIKDIIIFFSKYNIYEYDLLYLIPFGRAYNNKDELFVNDKDLQNKINDFLLFSREDKYYIWANRFPVHLLEGYEDLIQDPHKLYDEIKGRQRVFDYFYKHKRLYCYEPKRCDYCFIKGFCEKFLSYMNLVENKKRIKKNKTLKVEKISDKYFSKFKKKRFKTLIILNDSNNKIILKNIHKITELKDYIFFIVPAYEKLSEAKKEYDKINMVFNSIKEISIINCAKCLNESGDFTSDETINLDVINNENKIDLTKLVQDYIINDYYVKSIRCTNCIYDKTCKGMHINYIRTFGFKTLKEIR